MKNGEGSGASGIREHGLAATPKPYKSVMNVCFDNCNATKQWFGMGFHSQQRACVMVFLLRALYLRRVLNATRSVVLPLRWDISAATRLLQRCWDCSSSLQLLDWHLFGMPSCWAVVMCWNPLASQGACMEAVSQAHDDTGDYIQENRS